MTQGQPGGPQVIVVGVDGSGHADAALAWAIEEARLRNATLRIVHAWQYLPMVAEPMAAVPATPYEDLSDAAQRVVTETVERVTGGVEAGVPMDVRIVEGAAGAAVLDAAEDATMIVVGSRGRGGFTGLLLGSVSQQITHHAHCPVVVLPKGVDH
jgi:nucleotide-binding universal stress UspA family protein